MFKKLFTALAVAGCLSGTPAAAVEVNLLCVGNSISEGAGLADPKRDAPPVKLAALLGNEPGIDGVNLINGGRSGSTTTDWLPSARDLYPWFTAMADTLVANHPDAVTVFSISLGTNDSACDRCKGAPASRETFRSNLRTIIDSLITRYPGSLAVLHAPIWYSPNTYNGARYLVEGQRRLLPYRHEIERLTEEYSATRPGRVWLGDTLGYNYFKEKHLTDMQPENGHAGIFYLHPNEKGGTALASLWHKPVMAALRPRLRPGKEEHSERCSAIRSTARNSQSGRLRSEEMSTPILCLICTAPFSKAPCRPTGYISTICRRSTSIPNAVPDSNSRPHGSILPTRCSPSGWGMTA